MKRYKNILFDLDGTLIDTKPGVLGCVKKAFAKLSLPLPPEDKLIGFMGPPLEQCFTDVCGLSTQKAKTAMEVYRKYYEEGGVYDAAPFDGIPELLGSLKGAGYRLGVATSKAHRFSLIVLRHCGIDGYFESIAGASESIEQKWTKKDSILKAISNLAGAKPEETVIIGDRKFDAEGAAEAGIDAVGVLFGYGGRDELEKSGFCMIAESVNDLKAIFIG